MWVSFFHLVGKIAKQPALSAPSSPQATTWNSRRFKSCSLAVKLRPADMLPEPVRPSIEVLCQIRHQPQAVKDVG